VPGPSGNVRTVDRNSFPSLLLKKQVLYPITRDAKKQSAGSSIAPEQNTDTPPRSRRDRARHLRFRRSQRRRVEVRRRCGEAAIRASVLVRGRFMVSLIVTAGRIRFSAIAFHEASGKNRGYGALRTRLRTDATGYLLRVSGGLAVLPHQMGPAGPPRLTNGSRSLAMVRSDRGDANRARI